MDHCSVSWEITLLYFFSWNCTWFGQKEPIKVQNFRLSTAHVKFHQICTLIGSLKYKILAKKYRGVISHDLEDWCKIWRKTDLLFLKWQEFGEIDWCKIWGKTDLWFGKWHEEYGEFSLEHLKASKLGFWWDPFVLSKKCMSLTRNWRIS